MTPLHAIVATLLIILLRIVKESAWEGGHPVYDVKSAVGHVSSKCPGKPARLLPEPYVNGALLANALRINEIKSSALLDTSFSQSLVIRTLYYSWKTEEKVDVLNDGERTLRVLWLELVPLGVNNWCLIKVLVVDGKLLLGSISCWNLTSSRSWTKYV